MSKRCVKTYAPEVFERHGLDAAFWDEEARNTLGLMIKPSLRGVKRPVYFLNVVVETYPSEWWNCWWAKLLRRIYHGLVHFQLHDKLLPFWLIQLIWARGIHINNTLEELPVSILERVSLMAHYLRVKQGIEPSKVLMGSKARYDLYGELTGYTDYWPANVYGADAHEKIFGLEIQVNPFLEEDAVIVC